MGLFQDINLEAARRGLEFLVIGGIAVIFHGYSRDTADLDLLIRSKDRGAWQGLLSSLSYTVHCDGGNFIQWNPPERGAWPVDLMLVNDTTFETMLKAAMQVEMYDTRLKIPMLDHLLALKLHALKYGSLHRETKDRLDVEALIRVNSIDIASEKMRQLFLKYGTLRLYEQISRFAGGE